MFQQSVRPFTCKLRLVQRSKWDILAKFLWWLPITQEKKSNRQAAQLLIAQQVDREVGYKIGRWLMQV
jgi:hypothetical protein